MALVLAPIKSITEWLYLTLYPPILDALGGGVHEILASVKLLPNCSTVISVGDNNGSEWNTGVGS